eukprot:CAMPEP_0173400108 /NCGR_PEP_ID=MMETSP1356-20130122/46943_1 /TAXON_ID=77927 ORGANISM="Hemiselmis virescens, Strain PCC157" /NCGR_SAMPLE_ID=MMETSP1356 /ASSEMBLY_ACC=CAM_ASM_000847 /LENGTH=74 /DNA_ID=CAMNT_0014359977 /DNA_START=141 /DNA_END=365 /DNA_ORIENTATION=+
MIGRERDSVVPKMSTTAVGEAGAEFSGVPPSVWGEVDALPMLTAILPVSLVVCAGAPCCPSLSVLATSVVLPLV